jgi:uncharacterized membrane protein
MLIRLSSAFLLSLLVISNLGCAGQGPKEAEGTAFGALTGAMLGAAVADDPLAGAAIGGLGGAVVGNAIGEGQDYNDRRNQAAFERKVNYAQREATRNAVSMDDVIIMTRQGVSPDIIAAQVRSQGVTRKVTSADLITLTNAGVSGNVISAMQSASPRAQVNIIQHQPAPTVVEHVYHEPYCHPGSRVIHHRHARRPQSSFGFHITK